MEYDLTRLKKEILEGRTPDDISKENILWCAATWNFIMGTTHARFFTAEVFNDPERFYGFAMMALEKRIKELGGIVVTMKNIQIPQDIYDKALADQATN